MSSSHIPLSSRDLPTPEYHCTDCNFRSSYSSPSPQSSRRLWPGLICDKSRKVKSIAYGGDYNPDQWPEESWDEDIRLMVKAGINTVAVGVFSWGRIQPAEDEWDFDWLDTVIDKLGSAGISVDLGTATASAPLWLYEKYPQILPVQKDGIVVGPGSRQSWRPESMIYRKFALELCRRLAERYGDNPTVTAWHVGNEYGWNNRLDYSDDALRGFRLWCREKYGSVSRLNEAWGTAVWSQQVANFDQILLPYHMGDDSMVNPAQELDFQRYSSDALLAFYRAERNCITEICPEKPCTTNFMISTDQCAMNYARWSKEVDFVSNDHYFFPGPDHVDELLCSDSLVRSLSDGGPWYLMEHSPSAVQWRGENARKQGQQLTRDALAHIAMGADAINFFQFRQSQSGAEAFHSGMVPHAGENSSVFRQICDLGKVLECLSAADLTDTRLVSSPVAIIFDADSEWASHLNTLPSRRLSHWKDVLAWHQAFADRGINADIITFSSDLHPYKILVLPTVLALSDQDSERIKAFAQEGGTVIINHATGLFNRNMQVGLGGYPSSLRDLVGVRVEEFNISDSLPGGRHSVVKLASAYTMESSYWQSIIAGPEDLDSSIEVLARYSGSEADYWGLSGLPAITRKPYGRGCAYYLGCDLGRQALSLFLLREINEGFLNPAGFLEKNDRDEVEEFAADYGQAQTHDSEESAGFVHLVRRGSRKTFHFYFNRGRRSVQLNLPAGTILACDKATAISIQEHSSPEQSAVLGPNGFVVLLNS